MVFHPLIDETRSARGLYPAIVFLFLGLLLLLPGFADAREFPAFYERDYETAKKLNDLYEKLEAAESLFMLDSANDAIVGGACRAEDQAYQRAYDGLAQLGGKLSRGGSLSASEQQRYRQLQQVSKQDWQRFEACFDEQITRPVFADRLPPGVSSYATAIATYDRLMAENPGEFTEGQIDANVAQIETEIERIEAQQAYIAVVTSVFKGPTVSSIGSAGARELRPGDELAIGDTVRTSGRGRVRIELYDRIEERNVGPTVLNIGENSEVRLEGMNFHRRAVEARRAGMTRYELAREAVVDAVRGTIRVLTKGYLKEAAFSVRTGTSLCGIRGTDVEILYDPATDLVDYKLYEGTVEIRTPARKLNLNAGNGLRVRDGIPGAPKPMADGKLPPEA